MRGRYVVAAALLLIALAISANATAFVYRWLRGEVTISELNPEQVRGILCTGFYSSLDQQGIDLPAGGTNYNTPTHSGQSIQVTPGQVECSWNNGQYKLYESIRVKVPLTVGIWYIKDFYAFGYKKKQPDDPAQVYVSFKVENALNEAGIVEAKLIIINAQDNAVVQELNLKQSLGFVGPKALPADGAYRLSLYIESNQPNSQADFEVRFAVAAVNEPHD